MTETDSRPDLVEQLGMRRVELGAGAGRPHANPSRREACHAGFYGKPSAQPEGWQDSRCGRAEAWQKLPVLSLGLGTRITSVHGRPTHQRRHSRTCAAARPHGQGPSPRTREPTHCRAVRARSGHAQPVSPRRQASVVNHKRGSRGSLLQGAPGALGSTEVVRVDRSGRAPARSCRTFPVALG